MTKNLFVLVTSTNVTKNINRLVTLAH